MVCAVIALLVTSRPNRLFPVDLPDEWSDLHGIRFELLAIVDPLILISATMIGAGVRCDWRTLAMRVGLDHSFGRALTYTLIAWLPAFAVAT